MSEVKDSLDSKINSAGTDILRASILVVVAVTNLSWWWLSYLSEPTTANRASFTLAVAVVGGTLVAAIVAVIKRSDLLAKQISQR
jgi:biotin transporter BioY